MHTRAYNAWRRAESFQIPVTEEGLQQAEQRHQWFLRGFEAGVRCAAEHLELKHKEVKDTTRAHNFYLVASRFVRELYQEEKVLTSVPTLTKRNDKACLNVSTVAHSGLSLNDRACSYMDNQTSRCLR